MDKKIVVLAHLSVDGRGSPNGYTYISGSTVEEVKEELKKLKDRGWINVDYLEVYELPVLSLEEFLSRVPIEYREAEKKKNE